MSIWQLALKSMRHFWRTNLALLLGIAVGTAVLTGALIVGDSIRNSLKTLTLERLGRIDEILLGEQFFRAELAQSLNANLTDELKQHYPAIQPAILLNKATVELDGQTTAQGRVARVQGVTVIGASEQFWTLGDGVTPKVPQQDEIVINESLAAELGANIGDRLLIRVGKPSSVAADSPLARKSDLLKTIVDLELIDIVPARGLGRFSLQASQQIPANAFVSLETLQEGLDQEGKVNSLLIAGNVVDQAASDDVFAKLKQAMQPTIADLGISLERVEIAYETDQGRQVVSQYDTLTNARMLFAPENDDAVRDAILEETPQPVFTYLSTKLQRLNPQGEPVGEIVPYSTIAGVDSIAELGPLLDDEGANIELNDDEIALNGWAADVLEAEPGDSIQVTYFDPETTRGGPVEHSAVFRLKSIVEIIAPARPFSTRRDAVFEQQPTLANDPDLTPNVPGITDAKSIDRWDAPFPMDRTLLSGRDDRYWDNYRTTPKSFISLAASRKLWQSRFGETTSYRLPVNGESIESRRATLASALSDRSADFGMHWMRAKQAGLQASSGTTPFDALFFGFSMFIIASALMLVALLLRLNLEQRASQLGLVSALGFDWKQSLRLLLMENGLITLAGAALGSCLGIGYAWLMLAGLRTWWVEAVVTPFTQLSVQPKSLALGLLLGVVSSLLTIYFTLRRLRKVSASRLMAGSAEESRFETSTKRRVWLSYAPWVLIGLAVLLGILAPTLPPEPQGGAFFGSGACVLTALLMWVSQWLNNQSTAAHDGSKLSWRSLAARNLTRNPTRSTLTIGLVASACFLIVAISAFRLTPTDLGTGGFELIGQSDQPIFESLNSDPDAESDSNSEVRVFSLRLQDGDDASCRNLYQSARPRLIGMTEEFIAQADSVGEMDWAGREEVPEGKSPWSVLSMAATEDAGTSGDVIPVVLDKNTAMYSMQIYTGVGTEFERDYGAAGVLRFRIVGLLSGSVFQGNLLIPESSLIKHFPRVGGYRYFLADTSGAANANGSVAKVTSDLEERYSDQGLDLTDSKRLLTELLAVQNTYLSTFQSLGGLGLLLGTLGLAAVQLRNVMQRKGELALLRATGFSTGQLSKLVLWEHALLLLGGLLVGTLAALVVIYPHLMFGGAKLPIASLAITLGLVVLVGVASALFAQRYVSNTPLMPALRGD